MDEYSIQEMQEYLENKAEENKTKFCYILKESKEEITIRFGLNPRIK